MTTQNDSKIGEILLIGGFVIAGGYLGYKVLGLIFGPNIEGLVKQKMAHLDEISKFLDARFADGTLDSPTSKIWLDEQDVIQKKMELTLEAAGKGGIDKFKDTIHEVYPAFWAIVALIVAPWIGRAFVLWKLKQNPRPPGNPGGGAVTYTCPVDGQQFDNETQVYNHVAQFHVATADPVRLAQAQAIFRQQYEYLQGAVAVESQLHERITVSNWQGLTSADVLGLAGAIVIIAVFTQPELAPVLVPLLLAP